MMDLLNHGFEFSSFFGLPASIFPRYPPGLRPTMMGVIDQNKLKEKFFKDGTSMNLQLQDFNQRYQKYAKGLFEASFPTKPPGHPLFSRHEYSAELKSENDKLRKENLELKKQLEKSQKTKSN